MFLGGVFSKTSCLTSCGLSSSPIIIATIFLAVCIGKICIILESTKSPIVSLKETLTTDSSSFIPSESLSCGFSQVLDVGGDILTSLANMVAIDVAADPII
ncbi:hypothetical protein D3C73_1141160 [compost metagenome]